VKAELQSVERECVAEADAAAEHTDVAPSSLEVQERGDRVFCQCLGVLRGCKNVQIKI